MFKYIQYGCMLYTLYTYWEITQGIYTVTYITICGVKSIYKLLTYKNDDGWVLI